MHTPSALLFVLTLSAWGLAPWVDDRGVLVWVAVVAWPLLLRRSPWAAATVAVLGSAAHLAWVLPAWSTGVGSDATGPFALLVLSQSLPPLLALAVTWRTAPRLGWPLACFVGWTLAQYLASRFTFLPAQFALFLADSELWIWPAAFGGSACLTGLAAGWGAWLSTRPRRAAGAWLVWLALGLGLPQLSTESKTLKVGIVQPDIHALDARSPSRAPEIEARLRRQLAAVAEADFAALPEGAWPVDPGAAPGARRDRFLQSLDTPIPVLVGATVGREAPYRNSILSVQGSRVSMVHKRILVPVWEKVWGPWGRQRYRPGRGVPVLPIAGTRVGVLICYEDLFPAAVQDASRSDLLMAATNDSWNGPGAGSRAHLAASRLAAVTSGLWVIRPALNGRSAVLDRWGRSHWEAPWVDTPFEDATGHQAVVEVGIGSPLRTASVLEPLMAGGALMVALWAGWRRDPDGEAA